MVNNSARRWPRLPRCCVILAVYFSNDFSNERQMPSGREERQPSPTDPPESGGGFLCGKECVHLS
jgi:hypothetical protein